LACEETLPRQDFYFDTKEVGLIGELANSLYINMIVYLSLTSAICFYKVIWIRKQFAYSSILKNEKASIVPLVLNPFQGIINFLRGLLYSIALDDCIQIN
jgi:hypothetical protein